jgi:hypothetical protein
VQGSGVASVGCCRAWRAAEREIGRERRDRGDNQRRERVGEREEHRAAAVVSTGRGSRRLRE